MPKSLSPTRHLIVEPEDGVEPVTGAVARAEHSLLVKQFALTETSIVRAIVDAHRRGVDVKVMLNPQRSTGTRANDDTFKLLEAAGVPVRWTNPHFLVSHEKSIVVDDRRAFVCTFNLSEKYFTETRDYAVATTDPAQIAEIRDCFEADWERRPFKPNASTGLLWSPDNARERYAAFIDEARSSLLVEHPKFVDVSILDRLTAAASRGVNVKVLCGGLHGVSDTDVLETTASARIMSRLGIKMHAIKHPKIHCKMLISDRKRVLIGSMNIDRHAFELRRELGIVCHDEAIVERALDIFDADWEASKKYEAQDPLEAIRALAPRSAEAELAHDAID
ncbi:MAG: cardiolipin synthase [Proteobacteria bacterium]|nr:cardiolipin synthase [Pseudomonadota bacterium]